jgi:hypothetical protein
MGNYCHRSYLVVRLQLLCGEKGHRVFPWQFNVFSAGLLLGWMKGTHNSFGFSLGQSVSFSLLLHRVFVLHVQVKAEWFMHVFLRSQVQIPLWNTLFCGCVVYEFDFVLYSKPKILFYTLSQKWVENFLATSQVILLCALFTSSNWSYSSCNGHVLGCLFAWSHRLTQ